MKITNNALRGKEVMEVVAELSLFFSEKNSSKKEMLSISVTKPVLVQSGAGHKPLRVGFYHSRVIIYPFDMLSYSVYGANALQALHIASDINFLLEKISRDYDLFSLTEEPYFG